MGKECECTIEYIMGDEKMYVTCTNQCNYGKEKHNCNKEQSLQDSKRRICKR